MNGTLNRVYLSASFRGPNIFLTRFEEPVQLDVKSRKRINLVRGRGFLATMFLRRFVGVKEKDWGVNWFDGSVTCVENN